MGSLRLPNRSKGLYSCPRGMQGRKDRERLLSKGTLAMVRDPQPRRFYTSFGIREGENGVFLGILDCSERARGCGRMQRVTWSYPKFVWVFQLIYKIRNQAAVPTRRPGNILLKSESALSDPKGRERGERPMRLPNKARSDSPDHRESRLKHCV
jgi:hypothetical protein